MLALSGVLRRQIAELISLEQVTYAIEQLKSTYPDLVDAVLKQFTLADITGVLRNLVREGISIQDLPAILDLLAQSRLIRQTVFALSTEDNSTLLEFPYGIDELIALTEYVRAGLKLPISIDLR